MPTAPQWLPEQDDIVLVSVLDSIQYGYSKSEAFAKAVEKLDLIEAGRNVGGVTQRWYDVIAKTDNAKELIYLAKMAKEGKQKEKAEDPVEPAALPTVDLKPLDSPVDDLNSLVLSVGKYLIRIKELEQRVKELEIVETDYKEMCAIMVKARKLMLDDIPAPKANRYQVDGDGSISIE